MKNKRQISEGKNRKFLGLWIPRGVYLCNSLSWTEKLLLIDMHSLANYTKSNSSIGEFLGLSARSAERIVSSLIERGWIEAQTRGRGIYKRNLTTSAKFEGIYSEGSSRKNGGTEALSSRKNGDILSAKMAIKIKQEIQEDSNTVPEKKTEPVFSLFTETENIWNHNTLMALCSDSSMDVYGHRPKMNGASGSAMKRLLKENSPDEIRQQIIRAKEIVIRARGSGTKSTYWTKFVIVPENISKRWNEILLEYAPHKQETDRKNENGTNKKQTKPEYRESEWLKSLRSRKNGAESSGARLD